MGNAHRRPIGAFREPPSAGPTAEKAQANYGLIGFRTFFLARSDTALVDPATGKTVYPDAITPNGRPIEIKPRTPTGVAAGVSQLPQYERASGMRGRVVTTIRDNDADGGRL